MPAPNRRPNTGKPWTPEDIETLRRLAEARTPPPVIADRLGRSQASVFAQAEKIGVSIGEGGATRRVEQREARRRAALGGTEHPPSD